MIETYININTNEELVIIKENNMTFQYKLLLILLIFLSFNFAIRSDAKMNRKLIKFTGGNYYEDTSLVNFNRYYLNNYIPNIQSLDYFNITHVKYDFSLKYNIIRMEYNIQFYEDNEQLLSPSDFALYKNLQLICTLEINNPSSIIYTYPNVVDNKYYQCIEYFDIREKITIGIKLYQNADYIKAFHIKFFTEAKFNYNNFYYQNENLFEPYFVNNKYLNTVQKINSNIAQEMPNLKRNYLQYPYCSLKRKAIKGFDKWYFKNIYNDHFCFCVGTSCLLNIDQKCKQLSYISIIDHNQHLYEKKDYLFVDFIFQEYSYDDTYPVFKEMYEKNYSVHYLTENLKILDTYCSRKQKCDPVLFVHRGNYTINGDFVEKYLTLFLKLKAVVCSRQLNFYNNIFYITDYITYITIGHSILYFKFFSEDKDIIDKRKFDKIILPPSERVIKLAKLFGWEDNDILQINFPRWDKYNIFHNTNSSLLRRSEEKIVGEKDTRINNFTNNYSNIININGNITNNISSLNKTSGIVVFNNNVTNKIINKITNETTIKISNESINSITNVTKIQDNNETTNEITNIITTFIPKKEERYIFMMFSWRNIMKECEISNFYFDNITKILENEKLYKALEEENVILFFTIHGLVINKYRNTYKSLLYYKKHMKFIEQSEIANAIAKSELIITDFSSLMFDFIYKRKPYIFYIPDIDDRDLDEIYKPEYYQFYEKLKDGKIRFENLVYSVKEVVNKIIFYINNNFILEDNIKSFYDSFGIKIGNNTDKLINYLINLK